MKPLQSPEGSLPVPPALYAEHQDASPPLAALSESGIIEGPLRPAILRLALPAVGTTLFQVLFNITDTFWVGRTLGASALAAVSASDSPPCPPGAIANANPLRIPLASWVAPAFGLRGVWWMLAFTAIARGAATTGLWVWGRWEQAKA